MVLDWPAWISNTWSLNELFNDWWVQFIISTHLMSTPIFNVFIIDNGLIIKSSKVFLTLRHTVFPDTYFMFYAHDFFWMSAKFSINITTWCTLKYATIVNSSQQNYFIWCHSHYFFGRIRQNELDTSNEKYFLTQKFRFPSNESQLKNPDISGAIFTMSLSILEGVKYVWVL